MGTSIKPYESEKTKKQEIEQMFDNIAPSYDLLNSVLSLGIHKLWRKNALKSLVPYAPKKIIDLATGTADMAIDATKHWAVDIIIGVDISNEMLAVGRTKVDKKELADKISLETGDAENLRFDDNHFDAATASFGVRNFENLGTGLKEIHRVLRPGGRLLILEFTKPRNFLFKMGFNIYFKYILPVIGWVRSGDPKAYKYLFESVQAFPDYDLFTDELTKAGFKECNWKSLSFGICAMYTASK